MRTTPTTSSESSMETSSWTGSRTIFLKTWHRYPDQRFAHKISAKTGNTNCRCKCVRKYGKVHYQYGINDLNSGTTHLTEYSSEPPFWCALIVIWKLQFAIFFKYDYKGAKLRTQKLFHRPCYALFLCVHSVLYRSFLTLQSQRATLFRVQIIEWFSSD